MTLCRGLELGLSLREPRWLSSPLLQQLASLAPALGPFPLLVITEHPIYQSWSLREVVHWEDLLQTRPVHL